MLSVFRKFKEGLTKTAQSIAASVGGVLGLRSVDASSIESLEESLYAADFGVETTEEILDEIKAAMRTSRSIAGNDAATIGAKVLKRVLKDAEGRLEPVEPGPTVICLIGVNGSGKTTTAAKLGFDLKQDGRKVLLAACDTFRAAAIDQIKAWADRLDLEVVAGQHGADAAAVAYDALAAAKARGFDTLIIDTAGRLHTKSNLMQELAKIRRVLQKQDESAPHYSLLVVDGSLGTNSLEQAKVFHREFGIDGLIVTKLDGTSKGGALVAIHREMKLPIFFLGLGEKAEDLQPFSVDNYVNAIFGLDATSRSASAS
ncbi:MAG: signal recognition particle-docking protein FtsY [Verrucomicrobia bacterium]|nr:MAG: signal recognition particle-docking protein FtsY [Verrucomicrobiota bacterium]